MTGDARAGDVREAGFTIVELALGMVLFSLLAYVSMSLVTLTARTMGRVFAEYQSRKQVLVLQREMAEGGGGSDPGRRYGGYLAAADLSFGPGGGELAGAMVFWIEYPDFDDSDVKRHIEYVLRPGVDGGSIWQRFYAKDGTLAWDRKVLDNVAGFEVCKLPEDRYTFRVTIGHRVQGFANPIERSTEGQARNMALSRKSMSSRLPVCEEAGP